MTEVVGTSTEGLDQAIRTAVAKASETLRHMDWFEVTDIRGHLGGDASVQHLQVTMKLGFRLDEQTERQRASMPAASANARSSRSTSGPAGW